jgi:PIN domain nuclease of toxin-antitoxin system
VNLLLDTHIWLWAAQEQHKLTSEVHRAITNPENSRYLSPISVWEVILLLEKKRIEINQDFGQWFEKSRIDYELQEAPLDWKVVHELRFMMLGYSDPADRFLAATAMAHGLTLVTADERLLRVPHLNTLPNI